MEKLAVIGVGPGADRCVTPEAREAIGRAEIVYAAARHAHLAGEGKLRPLEPLPAALSDLRDRLGEGRRAAVLVSGDAGLYSLLPALVRAFGRENLSVVPGVGALQALCAALGETWQGAAILSAHGRELPESALAHAVRTHARTFVFCGADRGPGWIGEALRRTGVAGVEIAAGERLSYPDQRIARGLVDRIGAEAFGPLCVARVLNPDPVKGLPPIGIPDGEFLRGGTPMTKREVRALAVCALRLEPDSVVWDIGAGTGSVSVECARQCPEGTVYAVERDAEALALLRKNADRFFAVNLEIVAGAAPEILEVLPAPTRVFLGGSGGEMDGILAHLERRGAPVRLVATAVTLESAHALVGRLAAWKNPEAAQVAVSRLERIGGYHLFRAQNPVFLISADWEGAE